MNTIQLERRERQRLLKKQEGATLFFAMIGLVVLMLAAAALVRTVDTNVLIAGNIAFRQSASNAADAGMENAINWISTTTTGGGPVGSQAAVNFAKVATQNSVPASGYYASTSEVELFNSLSPSYVWTGGRNNDLGTDNATGNRVRFVIERMCRTTGILPIDTDCLFTAIPKSGTQKGRGAEGLPNLPDEALIFRITIRVDGPRNTVSYAQGFVY